jgi:hypothetical protein
MDLDAAFLTDDGDVVDEKEQRRRKRHQRQDVEPLPQGQGLQEAQPLLRSRNVA